MNVRASLYQTPPSTRFRPNPAETIEKGVELGADAVQQDLFALTAGISDVKSAAEFSDMGKAHGITSWQKGAYSTAAALAGAPATGLGLVQAVEGLWDDPVGRGFFALAGAFSGTAELGRLKEVTSGYGTTAGENGLIGVAAALAGAEGAQESIGAGLSEGSTPREGSFLTLATALVGGAQELAPTVSVARDFASSADLVGPYAVAVALAGRDEATSALRMAEDLGQTAQEKALFAIVGGLVGAERAPGFVRMSRALSPSEGQVGPMAVAAALTAADAPQDKEAAAAAVALMYES